MAFAPRSAEEILDDFVNYLTVNTKLTDFNVGSVIRTLLEVVAIEDATQYRQMFNVLNSFFLDGATGDALNDRAAQYGMTRKEATPSSGAVFFLDTSLEKAFLVQDLVAGVSTSIAVDDASPFPATPFEIRLGEGTGGVEDVTINVVDLTTNILTAAAPVVHNHSAAGSFVDSIDNRSNLACLVTGLPDRTISSGLTLRSAGTNVNVSVSAYTTANTVLPNGNFVSNPVGVATNNFGPGSIIPPKMLNSIIGAVPFFGAKVINLEAISGGAAIESDSALRSRIRDHIGGLSAGTINAIREAILNSGDAAQAERITKIKIFEDFANSVAFAYVNTGNDSFIGTKDLAITDTTSVDIIVPGTNISINNVLDFPEATAGNLKWSIIDPSNANGKLKVFQYNSKLAAGVVSNFAITTVPGGFPIPAGTIIVVPEVLSTNTEFNKKYYQLINFPLTEDNIMLHRVTYNNPTFDVDDGSDIVLLVEGTDYIINEAIGQIEFLEGKIPMTGSALLATYNVYTGIVKAAQTAVDGDLTDPANFPGVRSAGVKIRVIPALLEKVDFVIDVTYQLDLANIETLQFLSEQAIRSYVVGLPIGGDIILAEIIDRLMDIIGVTNVHIKSPSDDVSILHDHYAAVGIVTVS